MPAHPGCTRKSASAINFLYLYHLYPPCLHPDSERWRGQAERHAGGPGALRCRRAGSSRPGGGHLVPPTPSEPPPPSAALGFDPSTPGSSASASKGRLPLSFSPSYVTPAPFSALQMLPIAARPREEVCAGGGVGGGGVDLNKFSKIPLTDASARIYFLPVFSSACQVLPRTNHRFPGA